MKNKHGLDKKQIEVLVGALNPNRVAHRSQGGRDLSYLEAFDVKATLIRVFGFAGFSAECIHTSILREHWYMKDTKELVQVTALCTVRLTIHQTGAVYQESGAASQSGPDHGEVCDFAIKTAESDALKRAATYLGTQFGLSLYANGSTRDVVRVLFAPDQRDHVEPPKPLSADLSDEQAQTLKDTLGATVVSDSDAQPQPAASDGIIRTAEDAAKAIGVIPQGAS